MPEARSISGTVKERVRTSQSTAGTTKRQQFDKQEVSMLRFFVLGIVVLAAAATAATAAAAGAGGVTGPAFYVDGQLYRTVNTPTDLSVTGAPAQSFDTIYDFGGLQPNVATAAPGDPGYNGGRWHVHALSFSNYPAAVIQFDKNGSGDLDSNAELQAALAAGAATDMGVVKSFVCPVVKIPAAG
jgi:hypothetical protein